MLDVLDKVINIDGAIILGFLLINLLIGIYFSRGITNIKEYALGSRNFGTATIAYTIVATWIASDSFITAIYQSYKDGLFYIIPDSGEVIGFLLIAFLFLPRMHSFLGSLSIAEAMGNVYGNVCRIFTALVSIALCLGNIISLFVVLSVIFNELMVISSTFTSILCISVIVIYPIFGGMKAVTFTDVIQFFTFGLIIPIISFLIWQSLDSQAIINSFKIFTHFHTLNNNELSFTSIIVLCLFYALPVLDPALFQRASMAKNVKQASKAFIIAGIIFFFCKTIFMDYIGILLWSDSLASLSIDSDTKVIPYIIDHYCNTVGLKGMFIVAIIALTMSTADSYIHSAAILISYDLRITLGIKLSEKRELLVAKITVLLIVVLAFYTSTSKYFVNSNFFDFLVDSYSFYISIVSVPFTLAVFGFRSSTSWPCILGMLAGFLTIITTIFYDMEYGLIIGIFANLSIFMVVHYLLRQPGDGWGSIKSNEVFLEVQNERKEKIKNFCAIIQNYSLSRYLRSIGNIKEVIYVYLGFFCVVSTLLNIYSLPKIVVENHSFLVNAIMSVSLILTTILISYPAWLPKFKSPLFIGSIYFLTIFIVLILFFSLLVLINNFGHLQNIIFTTSIITASILLRLQATLFCIIIGIIASVTIYTKYTGQNLEFNSITLEFAFIYLLLMSSVIAIVFLKPKSDALALFQAKSINLWQKVNDMDKEVRNANNLKAEFLSNISHEVRTPITGITSLGQALWDNYDNIPESKRRECTYTIAQNSERLISLMNNILDFSNLTSLKMSLYLQKTNITDLIHESLQRCKKLYLEDKELRFKLDIENDIYVKCDAHYISQTIDNLIINAICYSKPETTVRIFLQQSEGLTYFAIRDEGIGIPKEELETIFTPFTTSTKTKSNAGGRGIGLALCYAVITAHKGRIWAESDGSSWAEFSFEIENTA